MAYTVQENGSIWRTKVVDDTEAFLLNCAGGNCCSTLSKMTDAEPTTQARGEDASQQVYKALRQLCTPFKKKQNVLINVQLTLIIGLNYWVVTFLVTYILNPSK